MENNKDKAAIVGISLVILVAIFTFARPYLKRDRSATEKSATTTREESKFSFISAEDLMKKQKNTQKAIIIDTRYPEQFSAEHIFGSINADQETIVQHLDNLGKQEEIFLLSSDSNDVALKMVAETLKEQGFENFSILSGGISAWIEAGGRTIRTGNPGSLSDQAKISIVKPEDLKSALDKKDPSLFILDLRPSSQYSSEHLPQAKNIPGSELESRSGEIPPGKNIIFYAESELRSFQLGVTLFDLGLTRSSALEGGIDAWKAKSFPTEK